MKLYPSYLIFVLVVFLAFSVNAKQFPLPAEGSRLIGELSYHQVAKGDYFQKLAEDYNVGFMSLMAANPDVDPFLPEKGEQLTIPNQMLLPFAKREGILINLPELRLYYFPKDEDIVHVFPIGIGRQGLKTPRVVSFISNKEKDPTWRPTEETRERYLQEYGKELAKEIPPGPNNPFGKYALRIGHSVYLIHGTNQRFGIGLRSSSGCIRMFDDDIKWLYENVPLNTAIRIVDQPIKMSYEYGQHQLIEVHEPLSDTDEALHQSSLKQAQKFVGQDKQELLNNLLKKPNGLVTQVNI